jgi:hypothetical protein
VSDKENMISQHIFCLKQSNREGVGKFSLSYSLNVIIALLSDNWLKENEPYMKINQKSEI